MENTNMLEKLAGITIDDTYIIDIDRLVELVDDWQGWIKENKAASYAASEMSSAFFHAKSIGIKILVLF